MGIEQSHHSAELDTKSELRKNDNTKTTQSSSSAAGDNLESQNNADSSRPNSPPISVYSDYDSPYFSYTDQPIGDSPKIRNRQQNTRSNFSMSKVQKSASSSKQVAHDIVVVKTATKESYVEADPDIMRIHNIPVFHPIIRDSKQHGDGDLFDRLHPKHFQTLSSRMQNHYNVCATKVATDQDKILVLIKRVDQKIAHLFVSYSEMQKSFAAAAESFAKLRSISQQLSRCNTLLNQNIESLQDLNNYLDVENRMEPFLWKTTNFY